MSFKASAWAVEQRVGDPTAKLLLLTLAEAADLDHAQCWPAVTTLASRIEASKSTTKRKLALLAEKGFIKIEERPLKGDRNNTNLYTLLIGVQIEPVGGEGFKAMDLKQVTTERSVEEDSPAAAGSPEPENPVKAVIRLWHEEFEQVFGDAYVMQGGADGKAAKLLVAKTGLEPQAIVALARRAWESKSDRRRCFNCQHAMTIRGFQSKFVEIREELKGPNPRQVLPAAVKGGVHAFD